MNHTKAPLVVVNRLLNHRNLVLSSTKRSNHTTLFTKSKYTDSNHALQHPSRLSERDMFVKNAMRSFSTNAIAKDDLFSNLEYQNDQAFEARELDVDHHLDLCLIAVDSAFELLSRAPQWTAMTDDKIDSYLRIPCMKLSTDQRCIEIISPEKDVMLHRDHFSTLLTTLLNLANCCRRFDENDDSELLFHSNTSEPVVHTEPVQYVISPFNTPLLTLSYVSILFFSNFLLHSCHFHITEPILCLWKE